ncbi:TetR/AcrR family transcriptional regulator [Paenibacillus sp. HWE-109]|uniref:TetR/AcrR family transcriptional regulator n=1 Tax=Paenibacillus sp. HWE-109 TaxID=1306526 RepID=UPI001EDF5ABF|nr:TetR/AcrR family transcriptional regulator [Paenibacillus sp. HWE-109]UKS25079.1 TetR/AcrR family transcriptional regulator [Paenibacillus sp. HWE-109]
MVEKNKKVDRRIVRSKTALRGALLSLMTHKPFTAISITEIVELANYNRGTFYSNYESKEALLDDIISDLIQQLLQSFRAPYEKVKVFHIDELHANSVMIFEHIFEQSAVYTVLTQSDVLPKLKEQMFGALKQILQEELIYPDKREDLDQELLAIYSIHALLGFVFHWVESGFTHTPGYMQEQLVKILNWRPTTARTVLKNI